MAKVGRPKGSKSVKVTDEVTMSQLAINQVEFSNKMSQIAFALHAMTNALNITDTNVNKYLQDMAKRIQDLEIKVSNLINAAPKDPPFLHEVSKIKEDA